MTNTTRIEELNRLIMHLEWDKQQSQLNPARGVQLVSYKVELAMLRGQEIPNDSQEEKAETS
ncbi:MAG: hypothetical protein ABIG95_05545 [Candidatus Woesearchaeota archaeon]